MRKSLSYIFHEVSELSRRKLSPTLASAHYCCRDNAIGLVVGRQLEAVGRKFSYYRTTNVHVDQTLSTILAN